jgi:G3E family GTPase
MLIVTGFLGVGKTTFILRVIDRIASKGNKVAVIVNDFGEVNVDGKVMKKYGLDVQELSGGCICCTLGVSLIETIRTLAINFEPDIIVMEPSGIADPESLKEVVEREDSQLISNLEVVVIMDAGRYENFKAALKKPFAKLVASADIILLNKKDLVSEDDIARIASDLEKIGFSGKVLSISASEDMDTSEAIESILQILGP